MSEPFVTNDGKTLHVLEVGDGSWGWAVWDPSDIRSCNSGVTDSRKAACAAAERAAGIDPTEPPAPPAWMVEAAREGCQRDADAQGLGVDYRSGGYDDTGSYRSAMCALQIALERGHVVEAGPIREMLLAGQGDDDGSQILPDLHEGMTVHAMVAACVHLLERRRDALDGYAYGGGKTRPVPTERELLVAAREDVAQVYKRLGFTEILTEQRASVPDDGEEVQIALQARRNMLREGAVAVALAAPVRDRDGDPPAYAPGDHVQKCTGDYRIGGIVRGVILTGAGLWRYAVEHQAEGGGAFLHIYAAANLSSTLLTREA